MSRRSKYDLNEWLAREAALDRRRAKADARKRRLLDARTWSGYRSAHYARSTGALIVTVDAVAQGLESDLTEPRWANICDDHDTLIQHYTLAEARAHAAEPEGWCEPCREGEPRDES